MSLKKVKKIKEEVKYKWKNPSDSEPSEVKLSESAFDFDRYIESYKKDKVMQPVRKGYTYESFSDSWDPFYLSKHDKKELDKDEKVTTADGKKYLASECIYISSTWFHKSHKDVVNDAYDGVLCHISKMNPVIIKLVISGNKVTEKEIGYVRNENYKYLIPIVSDKIGFEDKVLSLDCITGWNYKECFSSGCYVDEDSKTHPIEKIKHYDVYKNHFSNVKDIKTLLRIGSMSPSYVVTEGIKYSFGVEIEVSRGFVPTWKAAKNYNMLCIRDGSVNPGEENGGAEYVTGVLRGDTGVNHLQSICLELSKRCMVNKSAGELYAWL